MTRIGPAIRVAVVAGCFVVAAAWAHEGHDHGHATGVVRQRMEAMADMAERVKTIRTALRDKEPLSVVSTNASAIRDLAARLTTMFPPGSLQPPSEASPEIWRNFPDFESKAKALGIEAEKLAGVAGGADAARRQTGAVVSACASCHMPYRIPR